MTRDEFIDGYLKRSRLDPALRLPDGYRAGTRRYFTLPCECGDALCDGWAMVPAASVFSIVHGVAYEIDTGGVIPSAPAKRDGG